MEKKVIQLELELDTTVTDSSKNRFSFLIELAKAIDAWRIFPRIFISMYLWLLYESSVWFMSLPDPTTQQASLISVIIGAGAAWFGLYANTGKKE